MKKISAAIALTLSVSFALAACGDSGDSSTPTTRSKEETITGVISVPNEGCNVIKNSEGSTALAGDPSASEFQIEDDGSITKNGATVAGVGDNITVTGPTYEQAAGPNCSGYVEKGKVIYADKVVKN